MPLQHLQAVLARLYLDNGYRERFFAGREAVLQEEPLTDAERVQLLQLDREQVERFARSLRSKRLDAVRELLPATFHALGDRLRGVFHGYADAYPSTPEPLPDAGRLVRHIAQLDELPLWPRELARLEGMRLEIMHSPYQPPPADTPSGGLLTLTALARVERFRFGLAACYPAARQGPISPPPEMDCWLLVGKSGPFQVRLQRVNETTARVLRMCDGTRTLAEVTRECGVVLGLNAGQRQEFAREVRELLSPLIENGLIEVR